VLLGTSHWDGYTVFSVLSGALLVLMTFAPGLKPGSRVGYLFVGIAMGAYGIYVANQTSGTYYFPVYIFLVPVIAIVTFFKAIGSTPARRPSATGSAMNRPVARPVVTNQPVANPTYAPPSTSQSMPANATGQNPTVLTPPPTAPILRDPMPLHQHPLPQQTPVTSNNNELPGSPLPPSARPGQKIVIDLSDLGDE
jgi:hypothetical protein